MKLMEHPTHGRMHVYTDAHMEENLKHGWKTVEEKAAQPAKLSERQLEKQAAEEREGVVALADAQGVKYDARWSTERIKQAIEAANK